MRLRTVATAGLSIVLISAMGFSGGAAFTTASRTPAIVKTSAPLTDLTTTADPLDGASGHFMAIAANGRTRAFLILTGIATTAVGKTFGAHVHIGQCVPGNGAAAKGHYNTGGPPSPTTEVWLDFRVRAGGVAVSRTTVPFVIPHGGAGAVVIHAKATDPAGAAGARLACLPVAF